MEIITIKQMLEENAKKYRSFVAFQMRQDSGYRKVTFEKTAEMVSKLQAMLVKFGVNKGDRVALISENRPEWAISYLAITSMGAVVVPLDALLHKQEVLPLLEDSQPKAIILSQKFVDLVSGTNLESKKILMEEFENLPSFTFLPSFSVDLDDLAAIVYTSGTTGVPKGVMLTHRNIMFDVMSTASLFDIGPSDNFLSVLPLHHTFETTAGFLGPFYKGCTITYAESLKSYNILRNMQETGVTIMCGVPLLYQLFYEGIMRKVEEKRLTTVFKILFGISKFFKYLVGFNIGKLLFSSIHKEFGGKIRFFVTGGAAIDPELLKNFDLLGFTILQGYGLTETAPVLTCCTLKENKLGSVGKPIPGVEIRIAGGGEVGEILAFGSNVMQGYYQRKDLTAEVINQSGWLHTGDIGYLDEEGYLFITGRLKDVIVTASGVNVYPEEIEALLKNIPGIKEGCILGSKVKEGLRKGAEEVVAIIVPTETATEEEIRGEIMKLNSKLADYKRISRIIFRKEELPKTRLMKIKKYSLRKELDL
ncbi:MAG: AMP-dependent synthetase/ligase [Candidatus Margulisiibacteriota bacterium]